MALGKNRTKLVITVSTDMANRIDLYCEKMGVSRSALCGMIIGQGIMGYDKSFDVIEKMGGSLASQLQNDSSTLDK